MLLPSWRASAAGRGRQANSSLASTAAKKALTVAAATLRVRAADLSAADIATAAGQGGALCLKAANAAIPRGGSERDIEAVLGAPGRAEIIHRDDMVLAGD